MGLDNIRQEDKESSFTKSNIGTLLIVGAIGILIGMGLMDLIHRGSRSETIKQPDTTFNKVKLDSIKVKVGKHDTTIYKLNIKMKDDIEKSYQLDDSATVNLFKQLVTDK